MNDNSSRVMDVDINDILPNRFQPRIQFDEEEILELSDSIKEHGVIQPIVVRIIGDKYEIIAGERRYKASVLAGKETVPVIIKNLNDKDSAEIALIENVQRKNLTPIEEALSYKKILDMGYITQDSLAAKLGKSQSSIANKIRLLNLSDEVQEALLENKISERHARSLLRLNTEEKQNKMLNRIITERLTVRRTDEEIDKLNNNDDDGSEDSQKIIEKGEMNMNENNMFGMPSTPQTQQTMTPSFDIFGTGIQSNQQSSVASAPSKEPQFMPEVPSYNVPTQTQQAPNMQTAPSMDFTSQPFNNGSIDNLNPNVGQMQSNAGIQSMTTMPEFTPLQTNETSSQPSVPTMGGFQFDSNVIDQQSSNTQPVYNSPTETITSESQLGQNSPSLDVQKTSMNNQEITLNTQSPISNTDNFVPPTAPIIENPITDNNTQMTQQSENLFSFGDNSAVPPTQQTQPEMSTVSEFKMPEPIIVTDYNKQYDPVMPQTQENVTPKVDFREVINVIRDCSSRIEQYGFKIDVEEYDLTNLYQVVFKIEK